VEVIDVPEGGFSYVPGGLAYSQGVVALPGCSLEHVSFRHPTDVEEGFRRIGHYLHSIGRPLAALCAVELRSPEPLSFDGFKNFNRRYAEVLGEWGLVKDGRNAVARSNVAPVVNAPLSTSFHGFTVTTAKEAPGRTFVVSGSSEWPEGGAFPGDIVRYTETSPEALQEKARYVLAAMERRMSLLGVSWEEATFIQSYSEHDVFGFLAKELVPRLSPSVGVAWHYSRPPVVGWEYEMDVKGIYYSKRLG
jgi:hypothetical protein